MGASHAAAAADVRHLLVHSGGDLPCGRSGQARARGRMVGLLPPRRPGRSLRGDLLAGGEETRAGCGCCPAKPDYPAQHRPDRLGHATCRPALRSGLPPRADAQSGATRQTRRAVHRLLRTLRANRAEPGHAAERNLAAPAWRARYLRHTRADAASRSVLAADPEGIRLPVGDRGRLGGVRRREIQLRVRRE